MSEHSTCRIRAIDDAVSDVFRKGVSAHGVEPEFSHLAFESAHQFERRSVLCPLISFGMKIAAPSCGRRYWISGENKMDPKIRVFSTCPQSSDHTSAEYIGRVIDVARWSEANGCEG